MTPDERIDEAVAAFRALAVPPRPGWEPPAGVVPAAEVQVSFRDPERVASSKRSHRRLAMKLGIGGLAAAVAVGVGLFVAATPQVTLAQAVAEVKKHKLVRYKTTLQRTAASTEEQPPDLEIVEYRDLTRDRYRKETGFTATGYKRLRLEIGDKGTLTALVAESAFPLADTKNARHAKVEVEVKTGEDLFGKGMPNLLAEMQEYARHKGSVTTKVALDGGPAVKVVHDVSERVGVTVWLDPTTRLPLRVERRGDYSDGLLCVESGFEWDPTLPAGVTIESLFSTDIRNGYSVIPDLKK